MKWYLSGKTKNIPVFLEITKFLKDKGQIINSNWIYEGNMRPFEENFEKVQNLTDKVINDILYTDIFILFNEMDMKDAFVEFGICLAKNKLKKSDIENDIKIYIIDCGGKNSLMQNHKSIIHVKDLKEIFDKESIDIGDFQIPILI